MSALAQRVRIRTGNAARTSLILILVGVVVYCMNVTFESSWQINSTQKHIESGMSRTVKRVVEGQKARFRLLQELRRQPSSKSSRVDLEPSKEMLTASYPKINKDMRGLKILNEEPPVYLIDDFLQDEECKALIKAATNDDLESVKYSGSFVLLEHSRLWPIFPMLFLSAVPGSHAVDQQPSLEVFEHYMEVLLPNALLVGSMILLIPRIVEILTPIFTKTSGANFKGSKWVGLCEIPTDDHPAKLAHESFLRKAQTLFGASRSKFERPTVTRYTKGQGQAVHSDAYPPASVGEEEAYQRGGGQRLAQCLVYLNDVPKEDGGSTKFFHPSVGNLEVQPKKGSALVFFPAYADGTEDLRMMHSGEVYTGENAKWLMGTWLHESDVPRTPHRLENQPGLGS
eukprot:jgi/Bigna1/140231/aug1.55_g14939